MKKDNKKALYESIMRAVAKQVKKALNESEVEQQQQIIAGFSGIGKTHFINKYKKYGILDYDDYTFPKDPPEICKYIKNHKDAQYILLLTDIDLLKYLAEHNIKFYIIMPKQDRKDEFMKMYYKRDIQENHLTEQQAKRNVEIRSGRWDNQFKQIKDLSTQYNIKTVYLPTGKYFEDGIKQLNK